MAKVKEFLEIALIMPFALVGCLCEIIIENIVKRFKEYGKDN